MPSTARRLRVVHRTTYSYDHPIERSVHQLRLCPMQDWDQRVLSHQLTLSPTAPLSEYEDAFGNWVDRFELTTPYQTLSIVADSVVEMTDTDPFAFARQGPRPSFPVAWLPREQVMLEPYMRSVELPDTQMAALVDYARGFTTRNRGDLLETLFDINLTLFRDFRYLPGSTDLATTPYDVLVSRQGVCQDFANLFICLARLLGVPARYVCGYLYTGNVDVGRARSDASHAWVQVYIPAIGWKGFDPTNGVLPETGHVRVAYGRHYRDATPTSGTLYTRAAETLATEVTVTEVA